MPPPGPGHFYPYWTLVRDGRLGCTWQFGNARRTGDSFGGDAQYGSVNPNSIGAEYEPRVGAIGERLHLAVAPEPGGVVAQQPAERRRPRVVVAQVELVTGQKERPGVGEVELKGHQRRRAAGKPVQVEPLEQLELIAVDCPPVEREVEAVRMYAPTSSPVATP
jgi:hypothetical protein